MMIRNPQIISRTKVNNRKHTKSHRLTAGDAFMIDFSSPVEAVKAAIKIQQEIFHLNKGLIEKKQLEFRVGRLI